MSSSKLTIQDRDEMVHVDDPHNSKRHSGRHFKTYFLILLVIIFSPLGNVLLSTGMKEVGPMTFHAPSQQFGLFSQVFTSGAIWLGIASLFVYFISYMLVLSWADYSYVPRPTARGYV